MKTIYHTISNLDSTTKLLELIEVKKLNSYFLTKGVEGPRYCIMTEESLSIFEGEGLFL